MRSALSIERFSHLTDLIYEAALQPSSWRMALEALRESFDANYVSLIVRRGHRGDLGFIVSASGSREMVHGGNPYLDMSPFSGLKPDHVVTINDVLADSEWRQSRYYLDWCAPLGVYHVLAVDIATSEGGVYGFRVTRSPDQSEFSASERALVAHLLPHLRRALNIHLAVNQDRKVNSVYSHAIGHLMVGAIVLDEHGMIIEVNPMAQAIVDRDDGLRIVGRRLEATYANDNRRLQKLIKDALDAHATSRSVSLVEAMSSSRPSGQVGWGLLVQSIEPDFWTEGKHRPCVAVFLRDAEMRATPSTKLAQQLFQLTPAETQLAIQLANGLSLEEAAQELSIRRNTARAHLRSIFSKTGVRRQTELVRLFLNSVAWLGHNA